MNTTDELIILWCLWAASVGSLFAILISAALRIASRG